MAHLSTSSIIIAIMYFILMGTLITVAMLSRQKTLATENTPSSKENWKEWRTEAERQHEGEGPVTRRIPNSAEPPTLVLLRDHFPASLTALLALSSALYFALAMMIRGAMLGPRFTPDLAADRVDDKEP